MTGTLWFDNDPKKIFSQKVIEGSNFHFEKYSRRVTVCYVHPTSLPVDAPTSIGDIVIKSTKYVLPNHFWVGNE